MKNVFATLVCSYMVFACGAAPKPGAKENSSTLSIANFSPADGSKWASMKLQINNAASKESVHSLDIKSTEAKEEYSLKVKEGGYLVLLQFKDAAGELIFKSCAADESNVHDVKAGVKNEVKVKICSAKGDPVGTIEGDKEGTIAVIPEEEKEGPAPGTVPETTIPGTGNGSKTPESIAAIKEALKDFVGQYSVCVNKGENSEETTLAVTKISIIAFLRTVSHKGLDCKDVNRKAVNIVSGSVDRAVKHADGHVTFEWNNVVFDGKSVDTFKADLIKVGEDVRWDSSVVVKSGKETAFKNELLLKKDK